MVTGRFAPTPSGRMHLGNAFACLLAWLSVRAQNGRILLRIEDLDPLRTGGPHTAALLDDLLWLGLDWDGPSTPGKSPGPGYDTTLKLWYQSRRTSFYEKTLARLAAKERVYPCFCSRAQLHAASAPHASDGSYVYSGRCRALPPGQAAARAGAHSPALRLQVPDIDISFEDGVQGLYTENLLQTCGDFILRRSDGVFAYQLAATADDGDMGVTEVVRGRDLLPSAPRQIWLLKTLGYSLPQYCHVPLLLAPDGRRLAKRDRDLDLGVLRQKNKHPQALTGQLAHLAGLLEKPEAVAAADLIKLFNWGKIHKTDRVLTGDLL